jgi:hypothetical protein
MYGQRSFSQKAAQVMKIGGSIMLIPAGLGLILSMLILVATLIQGNPAGILIGLGPGVCAAVGAALLVGYHKHSRGTLDESKQKALWIGSAVFNAIPLIPILYAVNGQGISVVREPGVLIFVPFVLWWAVSTLLSMCALIDDHYIQKYR